MQHAPTVVLQSTLTCPRCGATSVETMPTDACVVLHPCRACGAVLRPLVASQSVRLAGSRSGQPREVYIVNAGTCP